jgi:hypothetical protein
MFFALLAALSFAACDRNSGAPASSSSVAAGDIEKASPLEKPYRLKDAEGVDVDRLFELFPLYMRPTYESASFDKKLGATVVTGLKFGDVAASRGFIAKRAELYGVDLDRIEKIKAAKDAAPDAPLGLVVGKLRLFEIESASNENARTTIGAVEIDSLRIREGGIPKEPPGSGVASFFNAFDVAGVYFKDVVAHASGQGDEAQANFAAKDLRIVGLGAGKLDAFLARDLDYAVDQSPEAIAATMRGAGPMADVLVNGPLRNFIAAANQRTKVRTLEWRDISFAGLMAFGLRGETPPLAARDLIDLGTARLIDTETFIGEKRLSLVPTTEISAIEFDWLAPSKVRAVTRGGVYDFTAYVADDETMALAALKSRKLDKVKADSDFAYDWSADKGGAALSAGFNSVGFADLNFDLTLDGLELAKIEAARSAGSARPVMELGRLKSFSMVIADEDMLDAFFALSAIEAGQTEKEVRAAAPTLMRLAKVEMERKNPRIASYIDALATFVEDGGTLEIKASPATPVPLSALAAAAPAGPDAMATAINLTVERRK